MNIPIITGIMLYFTSTAYTKLENHNILPAIPKPLELFLLGALSCLGAHAVNHALTKNKNGLGLGETPEELDKLIDKYQKHIFDLKRVIMSGSSEGKIVAQKKLEQEEKILKKLLDEQSKS